MHKTFLYTCLMLIVIVPYQAQNRPINKQTAPNSVINVISAASLSFDKEKNNAKILTGDVVCEHDKALLHCDTALIFDGEKKMQATGHILITKGDSIRVTGDKLFYDGKTKLATLEGNVRCVEKDMILTTNFLTFEVGNSIANYYNGGKIVNKQNTLTSKNGHYYSASKEARFHFDVLLENPEYKMNSDTLLYKISTKTAFFLGPSIILSKSDYIYCENGWYDTGKEKAQFSKNAVLVTSQQKLRGDSLVYDRLAKIGKAYRHVVLTDTAQKSILYGDFVEYKQLKSEALVTKNALYARIIDQDTLFLAADTLYHRDLDSVNNFLNAFHHVKIFKKDLQATCDSAALNTMDSLLTLFRNPFLWSNRSQATAKTIKVDVGKNSINGFHLDGKSFLIQQADSTNLDQFNQLSGRNIDAIITLDSIRRVIVKGNADVVYYAKNKNKMVAQNKTTCSEIYMWLKKGDVDRVTFKPATEGRIDPIKSVDPETSKLKGFNWQYEKRPKSRYDLFQSNTPTFEKNKKSKMP